MANFVESGTDSAPNSSRSHHLRRSHDGRSESCSVSCSKKSQDLQADALRPTQDALDRLVESRHGSGPDDATANIAFHEEHRRSIRTSFTAAPLLGAAGGVALVGLLASAASASSSSDVQILQTAASIENLAVATYKTALTLPYIGGSSADPVITKFAQVTMGQHAQHADAFNSAAKHLGGKAQHKPDPAFVPVVNKAVASLNGTSAAKGALGVVGLAPSSSRTSAAEAYVKDTTLAKSMTSKALFASIAGIGETARQRPPGRAGAAHGGGATADPRLSPGTARRPSGRRGFRWVPESLLQDQHGRPGQARSHQSEQATQGRPFQGSETELLSRRPRSSTSSTTTRGLPAMAEEHLEHDRLDGRRWSLDEPARSCWAPVPPQPAAQPCWSSVGPPRWPATAARPASSLRSLRAATFPPGWTRRGDLAVAAVAASLENLAVFAYDAGLTAATAEARRGAPAVATLGDHGQGPAPAACYGAWNAVLKSHGKAAVTVDTTRS